MSDAQDQDVEDDAGSNEDTGESSILADGGIDTDARAGRSQGIEPGEEPDEETKQDIEEERERRLDPDNRPEGAEVDNTQRDFDVERGRFTDSEDYNPSEPAPYRDPEDPNNADNDADEGDDDSARETGDAEESEEEDPS